MHHSGKSDVGQGTGGRLHGQAEEGKVVERRRSDGDYHDEEHRRTRTGQTELCGGEINHKAKYAIEITKGKYLKSFDGNTTATSDAENSRRFRTEMEAEIFVNVYGGIEQIGIAFGVNAKIRKDGYPKIVEL